MAKNETTISKISININKFGYFKSEAERYCQLSAFFHMLKTDLGISTFSALINADGSEVYIPYTFNIYETTCYSLKYHPSVMYLEEDEENFVEIGFDEVRIQGTAEFIQKAKDVFAEAESYKTIITPFEHSYEETTKWMYNKMMQEAYDRFVKIGNAVIKNGSFMIYPKELDERFITTKQEFDRFGMDELQYVVLRSNKQMDKMILFDTQRKLILATGMDELEKTTLLDVLKP